MTNNANKMTDLPSGAEENWDRTIGGFILNCGAVEFALIRLAEVISRNEGKREEAINKLLCGRIFLVRELAQSSDLSEPLIQNLSKTLDAVKKLTDTRNSVAHNPFVIGHNRNGQPVKGVMDVRKVKGSGPFEVGLLSLQDILSAAHRARHLANQLQQIISSIDDERKGVSQ